MKVTTILKLMGIAFLGMGVYHLGGPALQYVGSAVKTSKSESESLTDKWIKKTYVSKKVEENLADYPYEVTPLPYEMSWREGPEIAWVDNENLAFLEEYQPGKQRLSIWNRKTGIQRKMKGVFTLCTRDGNIGYIQKEKGVKKRYFGKLSKEIKLPKDFLIGILICKVSQPEDYNNPKLITKAPKGEYLILKEDKFKVWQPDNAFGSKAPGRIYTSETKYNLTLFNALFASGIRYLEHLDMYFIDKVSDLICNNGKCAHGQYNYSFFIDREGKQHVEKWDLPWMFASGESRAYFRVTPVTKSIYLYFGSDRVKAGMSPFKEVGLDLVDIRNNKVELILKGVPISHAVSPNGCKVAVSRLMEGNVVAKKRSVKLAIIDFCKPNKSAKIFTSKKPNRLN